MIFFIQLEFDAFAKEPLLDVLVFDRLAKVHVKFLNGGSVIARGKKIRDFSPGKGFEWSIEEFAYASNNRKKRKPDPLVMYQNFTCVPRDGIIEINHKKFRGSINLSISKAGIRVINRVGLEDYVRGVVGSEIGSTSPPETLKAQAVIARTYAYANIGKHKTEGFDLCSSEHCQVYGGVGAERSSIDAAVSATKGIIMISEGIPIATLYHATCGGMTSNNEDVFGGKPASYLRRVKCSFCFQGKNYRWTRKIPISDLVLALKKEGLSCSRIFSCSVESDAPLDRVKKVIFTTDNGRLTIKGTTFRKLFDLPSTTFIVKGFTGTANSTIYKTNEFAKNVAPGYPTTQLPKELVIQSKDGVKKVAVPKDGWQVLGLRTSSNALRTLDANTGMGVPLKREDAVLSIELLGRGFGHQVGLCQAGAIELGRRGWSYRQILPFYYTKVALRILKY